jgi:hypothetical protein
VSRERVRNAPQIIHISRVDLRPFVLALAEDDLRRVRIGVRVEPEEIDLAGRQVHRGVRHKLVGGRVHCLVPQTAEVDIELLERERDRYGTLRILLETKDASSAVVERLSYELPRGVVCAAA